MDLPPPPPAFDPREPAPVFMPSSSAAATPVAVYHSGSARSGARSPPLLASSSSSSAAQVSGAAAGSSSSTATTSGEPAAAATSRAPRSPPTSASSSPPQSPTTMSPSSGRRPRSPTPLTAAVTRGGGLGRPSGGTALLSATSSSLGAAAGAHIHHAQPSASDSDPRIFERDVEEPPSGSAPLTAAHSGDPHHHHAHAHAHAHDSSDGKVPTVLDDAVEALASLSASPSGVYGIDVEAPVPRAPLRAASPPPPPRAAGHPFGSLSPKASGVFVTAQQQQQQQREWAARSRSPSPPPLPAAASTTSAGTTTFAAPSSSPRRPEFGTRLSSSISIAPALPGAFPADTTTPWIDSGGDGFGDQQHSALATASTSSPSSSRGWRKKLDDWVGPRPAALLSEEEARAEAARRSPPSAASASPSAAAALTPLVVTPTERRRVSFVAYNDLLHQHPVAVSPLSDITRGVIEPDHLPGTVSPGGTMTGVNAAGVSSSLGSTRARSPLGSLRGDPISSSTTLGKRGSVANMSGATEETMGGGGGGGGGEWEREGLGQGLQQRLEMLVANDK